MAVDFTSIIFAKACATGNLTLSGTQTIDGVAVTAGQTVLAAGQTTATQNGPWVVAAGAWARPVNFVSGSLQAGCIVAVAGGTVNANTNWVLVPGAAETTAPELNPASTVNASDLELPQTVGSDYPNMVDTDAQTWQELQNLIVAPGL